MVFLLPLVLQFSILAYKVLCYITLRCNILNLMFCKQNTTVRNKDTAAVVDAAVYKSQMLLKL